MTMEKLFLRATSKTPKLDFDPEAGKFSIAGRSIPENSIEFYTPVYEWIDNYIALSKELTIVDVKLEYFNTSSSKCLVEVFRKFEKLHTKGSQVVINWFYEEDDEDMQESGEDFMEIIRIPFNMIALESKNDE